MSGGKWFGLMLAAIAAFLLAGVGTILLLLKMGPSFMGWHDNIGPEIRYGLIAGVFSAVVVAIALHARWSGNEKPRDLRQ